MLEKITTYWKSIASSVVVLYLSFAPPSNFNNIPTLNIPHADKFIHVGMYFLLSLCWQLDYLQHNKISKKKIKFLLISFIYPIFVGGLIEIAQEYWIFERSASWKDWFADIAGALLALKMLRLRNQVPTKHEQREIN